MEWLTGLTQWLWDALKCFFLANLESLKNTFIIIVKSFADAFASIFFNASYPGFLTQYSIGSLISMIPSDVLYFLSFFHFPEGVAMIAAAYLYRRASRSLFSFR
ncbi:MAG TPA: DUF2523 family protein [Candidatus Competibacteraceae bacterium]|nr:DUF2523 family protein [Candidatus Competibacteraceae bacterium]HQD55410.1 DUF2523 family protein [Candidatus Competibacteraceae bacterium]